MQNQYSVSIICVKDKDVQILHNEKVSHKLVSSAAYVNEMK